MQLRASFLSPLLSGSPKKYYCGIAGKLIYGPAVFDGNIGHFGKVIVDNVVRSSGSSVTLRSVKLKISEKKTVRYFCRCFSLTVVPLLKMLSKTCGDK